MNYFFLTVKLEKGMDIEIHESKTRFMLPSFEFENRAVLQMEEFPQPTRDHLLSSAGVCVFRSEKNHGKAVMASYINLKFDNFSSGLETVCVWVCVCVCVCVSRIAPKT